MSIIGNYIKDNFAGILVFGDVHADFDSFVKAYMYAEENNYFFMSLGDLVDRDRFPYETIHYMSGLIRDKKAGLVIGNHDDKFYRLHNGATVSLSIDAKRTLEDVGVDRQQEFLKMYAEIVSTPDYSSLFHILDDIILVHAAYHKSILNTSTKLKSDARSQMMYGEVNGERYDNGFPIRLYNWIDEIPMGKTVVVGHDRAPIFNVGITQPLIRTNANGGKAIFMDTGCGKGGFLSGMIILSENGKFKFDNFVEFK